MSDKQYLGDSVYCERDDYGGIVLTTENGLGPNNTIVVEPYVLSMFIDYLETHGFKIGTKAGQR